MKIMLSVNAESENPVVNPRFGRAAWLAEFDTDQDTQQVFANPGVSQPGGAGVAAAQFAIDKEIDAVISGHFGPNAARVLSTAGISMVLLKDDQADCKTVINDYLAGNLSVFSHE